MPQDAQIMPAHGEKKLWMGHYPSRITASLPCLAGLRYFHNLSGHERMAESVKIIPRISDETLMRLFEAIISKHKPNRCGVNLYGYDEQLSIYPNKNDLVDSIFTSGTYLIWRANIDYSGFHIIYRRGCEIPSPVLDDFKITSNNESNPLPIQDRVSVLKIVDELVGPDSAAGALARQDGRLDDLQSLYRSTILQLESAFASQIKKITSWTVEQADAFEKRKIELAEETSREREAIRQQAEDRDNTLKRLSDELDQRKRDLDDRDHMHARRAIRTDLQKIIASREEKFSLTTDTKKLRRPIHVAILLLTIVLLCANIFYFIKLQDLDFGGPIYVTIFGLAKQGLLLGALLGVTLYYVRWMNRWFEDHATAEFFLKQFQLDVDRASWIVEAALEWRRSANSELPIQLLDGLTRNLFARRDDISERSAAIDDLASALVGNASHVKVKVGENEVSFDRKGLSRLGKTDLGSEGK